MSPLRSLWRRLPVVLRAVLIGLFAASAGTLPWAWLGALNLRHLPSVPWGALVMAPYLWLYWRYASGRGWPSATSDARRRCMRARSLSPDVWGIAILAGILGIAASLVLMRLLGRLIVLPHEAPDDLTGASPVTILVSFAMAALVPGVVEEIAFRGYMQQPIERRHGPLVAILLVGVIFAFAHGTHSFFTLALLPFYLGIGATYGTIAWITDSILPGIVLHAGADFLDFFMITAGAGGAWERSLSAPAPARTQPLHPEGIDAGFVVNLVVLALLATATVWAYRQLAAVVRHEATAGAAVAVRG